MSTSEIQLLYDKGKQSTSNASEVDLHRLTHLTIHQIEEGISVFKEGYKDQEIHLAIYELEDNHSDDDLYQITEEAINFLKSNAHGHASAKAEKHLVFFEEVKEKQEEMLPHVKIFMKHVIVTMTRKHLR